MTARKPPNRETRGTLTGELALIEAISRRIQPSSRYVPVGIGDDCALLRPGRDEELAITTDFSLENVHFRRDWHPPESVGHRCLARGLSDLAAMGARPIAALLSMALPPELTVSQGRAHRSFVERFLDGFLALAGEYSVPLIGGDTAQSPACSADRSQTSGLALFDVVLLGAVKRGLALRRSGARAGDLIYVTGGGLGGAAAELLALQRDPGSFSRSAKAADGHPHLFPLPRVGVGRRLTSLATAAIDLSDGLSTDLRHLCEESGLAAEIQSLPIHPLALKAGAFEASSSSIALDLALHGGEDYELFFTAAHGTAIPKRIAGVPIHQIGEMKRRRQGRPLIEIRVGAKAKSKADESGVKTGGLVAVEPLGWEHFRRTQPPGKP